MSTTRYIVEGNLAIRETVTRTEGVPLDKMLENLTAYQPLEILPTPRNMRSIKVSPRPGMQLRAQVIVGHDPTKRRITHKMCPASSNRRLPKSYLLQFPYGLFWFALLGNRLPGLEGDTIVWTPQGWGYIWMKEPFNNLNQLGWAARMPNMYGDSRICFGANSINGSLPLGSYIDQSVNTFWTSEFNQDLENRWPYDTMKQWEDAPDGDWENWAVWSNGLGKPVRDMMKRFDEDMDWTDPVADSVSLPIPPLPMSATFDNLDRWIAELTPENRARLFTTMDLTRSDTDE